MFAVVKDEHMQDESILEPAPVALVTGAGGGIGARCAKRLARDGFYVLVADVNGESAIDVAAGIQRAGGQAEALRVDVTDPADCARMVERASALGTHLAAAVNNAGVRGQRKPVAEMDYAEWRAALAVNLDGVFLCMKEEIRSMLATGGGSIVNMSSILGTLAYPQVPAYVASKHGVIGVTRSAAMDYAADEHHGHCDGHRWWLHNPLVQAPPIDSIGGLCQPTSVGAQAAVDPGSRCRLSAIHA